MCQFGTHKFEVMLFGLINAPSIFQMRMDSLPGKLPYVKVYLDDLVVFYFANGR